MIYLIGVNHKIQHNRDGDTGLSLRNKFSAFLVSKVKEYNITLLAEEFSEQAFQESNATIDTVKDVAEKLSIKHLFCDPNKKERKGINIPCREEIKNTFNIHGPVIGSSSEDSRIKEEQRKYHNVRENFWYNRIEKHISKNLIFICGADHMKSFETLLVGKGHKTIVLIENWKNE